MRKLHYLGSLIRHYAPQLQLIEGNIECIRSRGRPITNWIADLTNSNGAKYLYYYRTRMQMSLHTFVFKI